MVSFTDSSKILYFEFAFYCIESDQTDAVWVHNSVNWEADIDCVCINQLNQFSFYKNILPGEAEFGERQYSSFFNFVSIFWFRLWLFFWFGLWLFFWFGIWFGNLIWFRNLLRCGIFRLMRSITIFTLFFRVIIIRANGWDIWVFVWFFFLIWVLGFFCNLFGDGWGLCFGGHSSRFLIC